MLFFFCNLLGNFICKIYIAYILLKYDQNAVVFVCLYMPLTLTICGHLSWISLISLSQRRCGLQKLGARSYLTEEIMGA